MTSQLNVDTIKGNETAGSITIQGEGSKTTNLQQGLVKSWIQHNAGTSITDSLNIGSLVDVGTANYKPTFANPMANDDYVAVGMVGNASDRYCAAGEMTTTLVDTHYKRGSDGNASDISESLLLVVGDLA